MDTHNDMWNRDHDERSTQSDGHSLGGACRGGSGATQLHQIQQTIDGSCSSLFTKLVEDGFVSEQRLLELLSGRLGIATGNGEKVQELSLIGINTRLTNSI